VSSDADYDFCNAYWVTTGRRRQAGEEDWGKEGYETILGRMRMGTKTLEDLRGVFKDRYVGAGLFLGRSGWRMPVEARRSEGGDVRRGTVEGA
jgi:hypothetical protein